jgi:hypothetical protein
MTEHEADGLRTLFQAADLESVPDTRDLIGPAVAWGDGRRRRDRWTAAGVAGAVAVAAAVGIVALRPGGHTGGVAPTRLVTTPSPMPSPTPAASPLVQRQLDALRPYLPAGYRLDCKHPLVAACSLFVLTGPTGATNTVTWSIGPAVAQTSMALPDRKLILPGTHPHQATAEIPRTDGAFGFKGLAYLDVYMTDIEARNVVGDTHVTDPAKLVVDCAEYEFTATGSSTSISVRLCELVADIPWKPGDRGTGDDHGSFGYNPAGPVMTPTEFADMATGPGFDAAFRTVTDLQKQAPDSEKIAAVFGF